MTWGESLALAIFGGVFLGLLLVYFIEITQE